MSVISLCVCKKRGCFRLDGRQPTQDMPSCHYKTKQLLCLCFSTQICSLPPPQPQLSTASQAPRTSSPLPAQVSPPAKSKYLHTKSNPPAWESSLPASSPTDRPEDHDQWSHGPAGSCWIPTTSYLSLLLPSRGPEELNSSSCSLL